MGAARPGPANRKRHHTNSEESRADFGHNPGTPNSYGRKRRFSRLRKSPNPRDCQYRTNTVTAPPPAPLKPTQIPETQI